MDARHRRRFYLSFFSSLTVAIALQATPAGAASYRTQNFIVEAPTPTLAQAVGDAAERFRNELASHWLGRQLPPWPSPCPIRVVAGPNLAAQGVTTYQPQPVRDFQMEVVGTPERILDSVLPHEVTHTVLATHFGRPLPRWADEGVCTTVEHPAEKVKHEAKLREFLRSRRGIAMNKLFLLKDYPQDVLPMYAQGYSVCRFLIEQSGPRQFIGFLEEYMQQPSWTDNIRKHYGYESLAELQDAWLRWVADGSGSVDLYVKQATPDAAAGLASAGVPTRASANHGDASVRLADNRPEPPVAAASMRDAPATSLASASSDGWYLRRRQQVAEREAGGDAMAAADNRRSQVYSAAQPQPEQQMGPAAVWSQQDRSTYLR